MKIGVYTDIHCCYTSSILPIHCEGSTYTTRLQMIIDTFRWMYDVFEQHEVDFIVNCGDLFDSCNIRSEEISALTKALSYSKGTLEYHILGNHDTLDKRRHFYSTALLSGFPYIEIIDNPTKLNNGVSFLPYMGADEAEETLSYLKNDILFSHLDIQESRLNQFKVLDEGTDPKALSNLFKLVINGHIHSYQKLRSNVYNIGATTSLSFSDGSDYCPGIAIVDTDSFDIIRISNPYAIRFIKFDFKGLDEDECLFHLNNKLSKITNKVVLRIDCKGELKETLVQYVGNFKNVLTCRVVGYGNQVTKSNSEIIQSVTSDNVITSLDHFLSSCNDLKYSLDIYKQLIKRYIER